MQIPTYALHAQAHIQTGKDWGGTFLPNNSRHSVGLNFVLAMLHPSFGCHHFLVTYLQTSWFWFCFHKFWDKGLANVASKHWLHLPPAAHSWYRGQQKQWVLTPNLCRSVEPLCEFPHVLYGPRTCQPFHGNCTFMSMRFLSCQTSLKLLKNDAEGLR